MREREQKLGDLRPAMQRHHLFTIGHGTEETSLQVRRDAEVAAAGPVERSQPCQQPTIDMLSSRRTDAISSRRRGERFLTIQHDSPEQASLQALIDADPRLSRADEDASSRAPTLIYHWHAAEPPNTRQCDRLARDSSETEYGSEAIVASGTSIGADPVLAAAAKMLAATEGHGTLVDFV